jgi:ankyrin repeat protein
MTTDPIQVTTPGLLHYAAFGKLSELKQVVESGINPDEYPANNLPAIIGAVSNNHYDVAEYLLSQGANPNNYTLDRLSALKSAAKKKNLAMVRLLLNNGADPDYEKNGEVALTLACDCAGEEDIELVELLLKVTDKKYYQKAYEYSHNETIRELTKSHWPENVFTEPVDGFGGPTYKQDMQYNTPPKHRVAAQMWYLLSILELQSSDPNKTFQYVLYKMSITNHKPFYQDDCDQSAKLYLDLWLAIKFQYIFDNSEQLKEEYKELYAIVLESIKEDDESRSN